MLDLSRAEIEAAVDLDRAFIALEEGFKAAAAGQVQMPPVGYLGFPAYNGDCHIKFGHIAGDSVFVVKIATGFYDNPAKGLPTTSGMMIALSAGTGAVVAILRDEGWLTDLRTALAGAIATRAGMRADARRIGIVGAGTQARFQIRAAAHLLREREPTFAVWARSPEKLEALRRDLEGEGIAVEPVTELEALCAQSDALITVTPAAAPIIRDDWIRPGMHITALGADAPGKQELDSALVALADTRIADSLEQSLDHGEFAAAAKVGLIDAGDCVELGAVLAGDVPARRSNDDITIADLTGIAVQDIAIARVVLDGIGR
ncbi:ornithine cyclodeaminase family protein [uncultured Bosea sp.]|uniref:ornithine cyclodeaminase family protein n=1 Tax=uncultured Bosea sp. TaxID=211457 RepID=UPI00263B43CC|nr:ornithine cyclodeaminase family protein [uncultured Bosea sp.]